LDILSTEIQNTIMERYWLGDSSGRMCNYPEWKAG